MMSWLPSGSPVPFPQTYWGVWSSLPGRRKGIDGTAAITEASQWLAYQARFYLIFRDHLLRHWSNLDSPPNGVVLLVASISNRQMIRCITNRSRRTWDLTLDSLPTLCNGIMSSSFHEPFSVLPLSMVYICRLLSIAYRVTKSFPWSYSILF